MSNKGQARWRAFAPAAGEPTTEPPPPEALATAIRTAARQAAPPVDLKAVIELWPGLRAGLDDLEGTGYLLDLGRKGGEIVLRASDPYARRRFTLSHELGHWLLAAPDLPAGVAGASQDVERWCDTFAVALLLPEEWVCQAVADAVRSGSEYLAQRLVTLPEQFGTSWSATMLRIADVTDVSLLQLITAAGKPAIKATFASRARGSGQALAQLVHLLVQESIQPSELKLRGLPVSYCRPRGSGGYVFAVRPQAPAR